MNILIVKLSAFGDIIHALPALHDLLARPEVNTVHWLVDQRYAFVCDIFPSQVIVHSVDLKGKQPLSSAWQAIKALKAMQFDIVLDLQGLMKSSLLARAISRRVFGIDRTQLREKASALLTSPVTFHADETHVVQQYRRVAAAPFSGLKAPAMPIAYQPPHIDLAASRIKPDTELLQQLGLCDQPYVVLHAAGGWETKQLPEQSWLSIGRNLTTQHITTLFSWGNAAEKVQAERLAAQCNSCALPERLNMSALCTLLNGAHAVVGADTGLLHLTAALATPTITFWGPSASWRSAPFDADVVGQQGDLHWHIESNPSCGPCFKRRCDQFVCMHAIDPEAIIRIIHEL